MFKNRKKLSIFLFIIGVVFTAAVLISFRQRPIFQQTQERDFIGNLHTHTLFSDGEMSYDEVIEEAKRLKFNFIAITDHDTIGGEVKEKCPKETRILCIIGEEISSREGHILAIDIKEAIPKGLTVEETIKEIHKQKGLAIPAHPASYNGLSVKKIKELPVDAVECNARRRKNDEKYTCELLSGVPYVYNSDAHKKQELSLVANRCRLSALTINSLKNAIKSNNCFEFHPVAD